MEGVAYPHRPGKTAALRRMQSEVQIGSPRATAALTSARPRDQAQAARAGFWSTVLDRPYPPLTATTSFHTGFPSGVGASSSGPHVQPSQSFHSGTTVGSAAVRASGVGSHRQQSSISSKRPVACPECDATYASASELAAHKEKHHPRQQRPFQCSQCAVGFSQKSHLNQHVRTVHQKVRPHKCSICDKAFGKKYDLSSHRDAVHSNERPHACEYCEKKFAKRSNLTRHKEKLHPEHVEHRGRR